MLPLSGRRYAVRLPLVPLLLIALCQDTWAFRVAYDLGYNGVYTTNFNRTPTGEQDEYIHRYNAGLVLDKQGASLSAFSRSFIEYRDYVNERRENELLLTGLTQATWHIRPGSLAWQFDDFYSQQDVDSIAIETAGNLQQTNSFSTGPDAIARLGSQDSLVGELRYGIDYYSQSLLGNQRYLGALRWLHLLTPTLRFSTNLEALAVRFDESTGINTNLERYDLFLRGEAFRGPNDLYLQTGTTRIDRDGRDAVQGFQGGFGWDRIINSVSSARLTLGAGYGDTSRSIRAGVIESPLANLATGLAGTGLTASAIGVTGAGRDIAVGDAFVTGDIFYTKSASLAYVYANIPFSVAFNTFIVDDDFEQLAADSTRYGAATTFSYDFNPTLNASTTVNYANTDYAQLPFEDRDLALVWALNYIATPKVVFNIGASWSDRSSNDPLRESEDIQAFLSLRYFSLSGI